MAHASKGQYQAVLIGFFLVIMTSCGGGSGAQNEVSTTSEGTASGMGFDNLLLAEVEPLTFSSSGSANLSGLTSDGDTLIVLGGTGGTSGDLPIQFASESELPSALSADTADPSVTGETDIHEYLREMEEVFRQSEEFEEVRLSSLAALTTEPEVGDSETFRVLSSAASITAFDEVSGKLRLKTDNLLVYVDERAEETLDDEDLASLANNFEEIALPLERELFGHESDINLDGRICILMTPVLNEMATSGGIVTGFFFLGDLYKRSIVNPASNARECFYTMVPDPSGEFGSAISKGFTINNILPGVLAHEYQHMTSCNQHVFRNRGATEEPWLNEGLSHLAEDLTGFGNENPSRVRLFLAQSSRTALIPSTSPQLAERGASYLFIRYLYEQSPDGDTFIQNLYSSSRVGVTNLESAFNGTDSAFDEFPEFLNRWGLALALSETGVTTDPRYNFVSRERHSETGNFTGICVRCDTQDGRGTVLGGPVITEIDSSPASATLKSTGVQIFRVSEPSRPVVISGGSESTVTGTLIRLEPNET